MLARGAWSATVRGIMVRSLHKFFVGLLVLAGVFGSIRAEEVKPSPPPELVAPVATPTLPEAVVQGVKEPVGVWVIPVKEAISKPVFYVIRRGLKQAETAGAKAVVLDMDTPGGELGVTLEIMEALDKFSGETLVYVNDEAISAGAIISSVADEIH